MSIGLSAELRQVVAERAAAVPHPAARTRLHGAVRTQAGRTEAGRAEAGRAEAGRTAGSR